MGCVSSALYMVWHLSVHLRLTTLGHARPLINLVTRLVKLHPLDITLLVTDGFLDQAFAEVRRNFGPDEQEYATSIRSVYACITYIYSLTHSYLGSFH